MTMKTSPFRRKMTGAVSALMLAGLVGACADNPATGGQDLIFMSQAEERQVGAENHPKVLEQFGGAYQDAGLRQYVDRVGQTLAAKSELPDIKWTFTLLDSDVTNAFALPGGYVYVTRGLLALAEDEDQLAAVVGHEIGHVTARHGAQRQAQGTLAQVGVVGLSILGAVFGGQQAGQLVGQVASVGAQGLVASYSRDQEFEADELGIRYNARTGYDPQGMAEFLAKLQAEKTLMAKLRGKAPQGSSYFDTHPPTPDRVARARREASKTKVADPIEGRQRYLNEINGMVWGDTESQGYARDGVFAHVGLNIRYEVPDSFTLFNSPRNVTAYGPGGAAIIFDTGSKGFNGSMASYIRDVWGKNLNLSGLESSTTNGLASASASSRATVNNQQMDVRLLAIRGQGGEIFRLAFLSPPSQTRALVNDFRDVAQSFRPMSSRERAALKPLRIRLYTVRRGDTIASIARNQMDISKFAVDRLMLLNGLSDETGLEAGRVLKVLKAG